MKYFVKNYGGLSHCTDCKLRHERSQDLSSNKHLVFLVPRVTFPRDDIKFTDGSANNWHPRSIVVLVTMSINASKMLRCSAERLPLPAYTYYTPVNININGFARKQASDL
jgi:hypothetical protein